MHFVNTERSNKVVIHFKSYSICVSLGFGGPTGDSPAVRPTARRRSDRREHGGRTGGGSRRGRRLRRSDRWIYTSQTGGIRVVRPADQSRSDRSPSISRVTFISAKSFRFLGIPTIHPPSGWLNSWYSILQILYILSAYCMRVICRAI